jgi:hypothetical protein
VPRSLFNISFIHYPLTIIDKSWSRHCQGPGKVVGIILSWCYYRNYSTENWMTQGSSYLDEARYWTFETLLSKKMLLSISAIQSRSNFRSKIRVQPQTWSSTLTLCVYGLHARFFCLPLYPYEELELFLEIQENVSLSFYTPQSKQKREALDPKSIYKSTAWF